MKKSLAHDGLARGLHEAAKALEKNTALLCVLAQDCNQPDYTKLVEALCDEHNVNLIHVPANKKLGEWAGVRGQVSLGGWERDRGMGRNVGVGRT